MQTLKKGKRVLISGLSWALIYIACLLVVKEFSISKPFGVILSFLPPVTFAIFIYHYIKEIGSMDEVERRIQFEAAVIAFSLSFLLIMTLGMLDLVISLNREDWGYRHLIPYLVLFYFAGIFISRKKYRYDEKQD